MDGSQKEKIIRTQHIRTIGSLDGIPGTCVSEEEASADLIKAVRRLGYEALSDAALSELASIQIERDDRRGAA